MSLTSARHFLLSFSVLFITHLSIAQACPATLAGGTPATSRDTTCHWQWFALKVNGSSTGANLTYQWETSADGAAWKAMPGFIQGELEYVFQKSTAWYRRKVKCGVDSAYSTSVKVVSRAIPECYCKPWNNDPCSAAMAITKVEYGTLSNSSICTGSNYSDFSSTVPAANIMEGSWLPIRVTAGDATSNYLHVLIDFNQNGTFDGKAEHTTLLTKSNGVYSGFIKVPFRTPSGLVRLRVIHTATFSIADGCTFDRVSETEDYTLNITPNTTSAKGHVIFVKSMPTGSNISGMSWTNAVTDVRSALNLATAGDTIKVAKGTYYNGTAQTNGLVLADSITLLGGYPDTGNPTDAQRNPGLHLSVLVGRPNANSNNSLDGDFHVMFASGAMNVCTVDGFVLQRGGTYYSNNASQERGGGISIENGANITVKNCVFRNNDEGAKGAAISVFNAKPLFQNCVVTGNNGYYSNILIQANSQVQFINLLAAKNGGRKLLEMVKSKVEFRSSTLAGNNFLEGLATAEDSSNVSFRNSILYYNPVSNSSWQSNSFDSTEIKWAASDVLFENCLTQVHNTGSNLLLGQSPKFRDTTSVAGADGAYFTADDGYTLQNPCSPAINAGNNSAATGITTDIRGLPRIFETKIDLGAYEVQQALGLVPKVLYVNAAATGANDGSSWANAYTDLHKALQACSDTIKVAAGTYNPWKTSTEQPYWLENKRKVLGAYPATGNPGDADRNYTEHPTRIDGLLASNEKSEILVRGQNLDSTSVFDGFTITNTGRYTHHYEYGAMIYAYCDNPVISNCTFTGNEARVFWGRENKRPQMLNCGFFNNISTSSFRLELFALNNSGKFVLKNCAFTGNGLPTSTGISGEFGRVMVLNNTNAILDSCSFTRNTATVMHIIQSSPVITAARFWQNFAGGQTTDLRNENSNPVFRHCIFQDSTYSLTGTRTSGTMYNLQSQPRFTDCQFYNGIAEQGGVAFNDSSKARFTRCVFSRTNVAFYNTNGSDIELTNCISVDSRTAEAPYLTWGRTGSFMHNIRSSPKIVNCVVANSMSSLSGVIYNDAASSPTIVNSIFWKNFKGASGDSAILKNRLDIVSAAGSRPRIQNSMFEFFDAGASGNNKTAVDPRFRDYENPIGPDSTWFTADDGLRLCDCSPAINSGTDKEMTGTTDLALQPRSFGPAIDLGAYELQTVPARVASTVYVNATAAAGGDGSSWSRAYQNLQPALRNPCVDSIHIAAGTYKPSATARDSLFYLNRNAVILGSYSVSSGKRDVEATPTILSGDIGTVGDTADNSFGVLNVFYTDSLIMDGIVVRDAYSVNTPAARYFNGMRADYIQQMKLSNCRFYNNMTGTQTGGAMLISNVLNTDIRYTVFSGNKAVYGAGVYFFENCRNKLFTHCVFDQNIALFRGGGIWIGQGGYWLNNCVFSKNSAPQGAGMLLENNPDGYVTNCTFSNNKSEGGSSGGGIYSSAHSWQGGGMGPLVSNCIFTGNGTGVHGSQPVYYDLYYPKNGYSPSNNSLDLRIHHTAGSTEPIYYWGGGNVNANAITYKNVSNPIGPDGKWFTPDDGLQLAVCSAGIDAGDNASVPVPHDLMGDKRIFGTRVDLGAYEFNGQPLFTGLLNTPNDSLEANKEITDNFGWTHYYRDCRYLLSIKKNGKNIGVVGDGRFELKVFTAANYGVGYGTNLTAAAYNTSGQPWYVMNRYWNVVPTHPVTDSILVRFPYTNADFTDVKGSNPFIVTHSDMAFFKVNGTDNPFDLSVPASRFFKYKADSLPSLTTWRYRQQDSIHLSEYYVAGFSGGGGGALYTGPLPDLTLTSQTVTPANVGTGGTVSASFSVANTGAGAAGGHRVQFYLSADSTLTPGTNGDTLLGSYVVAAVAAGGNTGTLQKTLAISCTTAPGNYYLFYVADGENAVVEANEANNQFAVPLTITAGFSAPVTPVISALPAATVCEGTTVTLTATVANCSNCTFNWSNGMKGNSISVTYAGNFTVTATNVCGTSSASQAVVVNPLPTFLVSSEASNVCLGQTFTFRATGAETYTWSGSNLNTTTGSKVTAKPTTTGSHYYDVTGTTKGCSSTITFSVAVSPNPVLTLSPADSVFCAGSSLTLTASGADVYSWSPAKGLNQTFGPTVIASPDTATMYTVTGTKGGCSSTLTRTITPQAAVKPSVQIAYTGCPDNNLQFTATPTNGGSAPTYQWYLNNVLKGTGATITLNGVTNGAAVYVKMSSGLACALPKDVHSDTVKVSCITTALPAIDALESLTVSPNPSGGMVQVKLKLLQAKKVALKLLDSRGRVVYQSPATNVFGAVTREIDLRRAAQGLYYLQLMIGGQTAVEKIVIAR